MSTLLLGAKPAVTRVSRGYTVRDEAAPGRKLAPLS